MKSSSDQDERFLVERCLSGDSRAWEELFQTHYRIISSVARWNKWGFEPNEMEDVTQDVLEEVVKGLRGFQFRSQVSTFIYQIAVRACIARIRERNTRKRIQESDCIPWDDEAAEVDTTSARAVRHPGKDPEEALLHRENIQVMKRALMNLDSRCREILGFRYLQELPCQEIAARLNVKENTLVVQIKRCLLRLVEYYQMEG